MQSVKVYAVKSMNVTDYVIEMKDGRSVYVFDEVEQLSASGVEKNMAHLFKELIEISPTEPQYQTAIELYKRRLAEVTLPELLKK